MPSFVSPKVTSTRASRRTSTSMWRTPPFSDRVIRRVSRRSASPGFATQSAIMSTVVTPAFTATLGSPTTSTRGVAPFACQKS